MKKILVALMLCFVSIMSFGQKWDYIKHDIENCEEINFYSNPFQFKNLPNCDEKLMPSIVYDRYMFGEQLMFGGWVTFGLGLGLSAIAGILYSNGIRHNDVKQAQAGAVFFGVGGAAISVSIPLLCFGDDAKREANVDYEVFNLLK